HRPDRGELARAARADQADGRSLAARPYDRHQVAGDRCHMRVDHAQRSVGSDGGVDRVAAIAQDLSPDVAGGVMRGCDNPARHLGGTNSIAPGWISKSAGRNPPDSPAMSSRSFPGDTTETSLPYLRPNF